MRLPYRVYAINFDSINLIGFRGTVGSSSPWRNVSIFIEVLFGILRSLKRLLRTIVKT
jgi:hypothetical protein